MTVPKKIAITGGSGAGKTTLGKILAKRIDAVFVEVDAIQHKANWEKATPEEIRVAVHAVLDKHSRWVIDGTCGRDLGTIFQVALTSLSGWIYPLPRNLCAYYAVPGSVCEHVRFFGMAMLRPGTAFLLGVTRL